MNKVKVRFLYFEGCPHAEPALKLLRETLKELNVQGEIEITEVKTLEDAERYNFLGSPTIQINGLDIEKRRRGERAVMGCRIYENGSGVPPKEMIIEAVRELLGKD
ncbi:MULTISPECIES: DF family (seleno)protein [unclassified Archaeoglobus]|jgi:hypothetical protein|uniref:DF family (seleno)protein n=1 Tax=unclassified Archaeoglobus TaxID=2643606 RepID=UPI0025B9A3E5|nr:MULTISPECIES: hypothetical protein [unclassified Archaeoglobus]